VTRSFWLSVLMLLLVSGHSVAAPPARVTGELAELNVSALAATAERLYVASFDDGLFVVEHDGSSRRFHHPALSPHLNALAWSEPKKTLWLGTARGLVRCRMTERGSCQRLGGASAVHALLLRADGSLIAGGDAGLSFVEADETTRAYGKKQNAPFRSVWSLGESRGRLFVGAANGLFWGEAAAFGPGGPGLHRAALVFGNLPDDWVTALLVRGDRLLVGTYNAGVVGFELGAGDLASGGADRALGYVNPAGLFALDGARVAVASMNGLRVGELGETRQLETRERDVTAVAPALGGGYWVGTRRGLEWFAALAP